MKKSSKKLKNLEIQYPIWRKKTSPTPCDKLFICNSCGYACWGVHSSYTSYCQHRFNHPDNKMKRMREATVEEYKMGHSKIQIEI